MTAIIVIDELGAATNTWIKSKRHFFAEASAAEQTGFSGPLDMVHELVLRQASFVPSLSATVDKVLFSCPVAY